MDLEHVQRLAQAFAQGVAFARGFIEMAQDARDSDEDGHWVTIGAEAGPDGEKHGGRPVFIKGAGAKSAKTESKKAESKPVSKKAESKKAESKPAQQRTESKPAQQRTESKPAQQRTKKSKTPSATGLLNEKGSALAQLAEREYDKVITAIKNNVGSINTDPTFPAGIKKYEAVQLKSILRNLKNKLSDVNKDLSTVKDEVSKAVKDGNFNRQGVESVWRAMKQIKDRAAYVVNRTYSETAEPGRHNTRGMKETAEALGSLFNEASGIRHDANRLKEEVRGSIAQFERENTERTRDQ